MSRQLLLIFALVSSGANAQAPKADVTAEQMIAKTRQLTAVDADGCLKHHNANVIVVCGMRDVDRKNRLPFPELAAKPGERIREPMPKGNSGIVQQGRCYVTMNERNCFKGVSVFSVSLGGKGSGVGGAAGRLWNVVKPPLPDEDYVKQAQERPLSAPVTE